MQHFKTALFSFLSLLLLFTCAFSGEYQMVRVSINSSETLKQLAGLGIDFEGSRSKTGKFIDLQISQEEKQKIEEAGFSTEVLIADLEQYYASRLQTRQGTGFGFGSMGGFYTFSEVLAQLDSMITQYPNLISRKDTIGYSVQNRPLVAVKISDHPNLQENEPEVLYTALHHAREPQSMMTILYYMWYLLENYGSDPQATFLVDHRQMWFIPVVNPDGYVHNQQTNPSGGGMWRKNARDNNNNGSNFDYYDGVDLNRNYGYKWGYDNSGSSPDPSSTTYRGPSPFSEPETQVIRDFCNQHQFADAFNYHTYSDLLIHPWAYLDGPTPDHFLFHTYGLDLTQFNGYTLGTPGQTVGYAVNGDANDWMYGEQLTKPKIIAYTPEVGNFSDGFWPPTSRIIPLAQENLYANIELSYIAGSFPKIYRNDIWVSGANNYLDPGEAVEITPSVMNYGLAPLNAFEAQLVPRSNKAIMIRDHLNFPGLNTFDSLASAQPWKFKLKYDTPIGAKLKFDIYFYQNGLLTRTDSLMIPVGTPEILFRDNAENGMGNWSTSGSWGRSSTVYFSPTHSFTDSPFGNYSNNTNVWMKSAPLDLSSVSTATLTFRTQWDIESSWDFGVVEISTNNGVSWNNLRGRYMQAGSGNGVQQTGWYGYDGSRTDWVEESIDLSSYAGQAVQIRFRLMSDGWVTGDGWYVDDVLLQTIHNSAQILPYIHQVSELDNQAFTGAPYPVRVSVHSGVQIDSMLLYYSVDGGLNFTHSSMSGNGSEYFAQIPPFYAGGIVRYFVKTFTADGRVFSYPADTPQHTLSFKILRSSPAIVVEPAQLDFTVPQFYWQQLPLKISNPGDQTLTYQVSDATVTAARSSVQPPVDLSNADYIVQAVARQLRELIGKEKLALASGAEPPAPLPEGTNSIVISDSTGDTNLPGDDILSVDFSEDFFNYQITINFAGVPDTNSLGIIAFDVDQNFGTGSYPPPFGFGLGNFDVGAEYEAVFDFANLIGDSLSLPPSVYILDMSDSIPTPASIPMPIQFSGSSASVTLLKLLNPFFDDNMNLGAMMLPLRGQALPDVAPDYGHGLRGSELGSSWVTELDTAGIATYPFTGSLAAGDSVEIFIKVAAAYPMGTYHAKLIIVNNSPTGTVEVPVTMNIMAPGQPQIAVTPAEFADTLNTGSGVQSYFLNISNSGTAVLAFTIADSLITGTNWLEIPQPYGIARTGEVKQVEIRIDPTGLQPNTLYQAQLRVISNDPANPEVLVPVNIFIESPNGISDNGQLPTRFALHENYPNPFNPGTTISFDLPESRRVSLEIFNILGQKVATLVNRTLGAGRYAFYWNGKGTGGETLSSGIYFYQLKAGKVVLVKKMLLAR